jgi:hypothetical protein
MVNAARVGAAHIAAQGGTFEPQRKNNFMVTFLGVSSEDDTISLSVSTFPIPTVGVGVGETHWGNEVRKWAGKAEFGDATLVLKDYVDAGTAKAIMGWYTQVHQPGTAIVGRAAKYKKQGEVIMFGPDGADDRSWKLIGCWPSQVDFGGGDMGSSDQNEISVTIQVDRVLPEGSPE